MGLIMLALMTTTLIALAVGALVGRLIGNHEGRGLMWIVIALLVFPSTGVVFYGLFELFTQYGTNVQPADVPRFEVPREATAISYLHRYSGTSLVLEFTLSEDAFLQWMKTEGRDVTPITPPEFAYGLNERNPREIVEVTVVRGHRWDDYDDSGTDDSGFSIVFDADTDRVHVLGTIW